MFFLFFVGKNEMFSREFVGIKDIYVIFFVVLKNISSQNRSLIRTFNIGTNFSDSGK